MKGADAWYDMSIKELLYPGSELNPNDLEKTMDILDVWFDSGSTQNAVLRSKNYDAGTYPADLYLEGSDQHRGWFQSSLLTSFASSEIAPYKNILTHGFTVDSKGEKMSKSKGNVVAPSKVIKQYGSEILRLWVAMSDYQNDLKISDEILKQMSEQYRKIRNTMRFLFANISDLDDIKSTQSFGSMDLWIIHRAKEVFDGIDSDFRTYDYSRGINKLNNFLVADLSNIYLDVCKDKLYCDSKNSKDRRASQSAMAMIAKSLIGILAPILTYTMDELLEYAPKFIKNDAKDIFDYKKYTLPEVKLDINSSILFEAKEKFNETIETLRKDKIIKSTLELIVYTDCSDILNLSNTQAEDLFLVSKVIKHTQETKIETFSIKNSLFEIYMANEAKCPRCWKYRSANKESLCKRCEEVIN
jgi:isoleucyl-tRNA synthetase